MAFEIIGIVIGIDVFAGLKLLDFFVKCFVRCLIVVKLQKFRELVFFWDVIVAGGLVVAESACDG